MPSVDLGQFEVDLIGYFDIEVAALIWCTGGAPQILEPIERTTAMAPPNNRTDLEFVFRREEEVAAPA